MVKFTNIASLTRNGLLDWLIQRLSALVIAAYVLFLLIFFMVESPVSYGQWHNLFSRWSVRVFSTVFLLCLLGHAWIGLWTVITDYIKYPTLRLIVYLLFISVLFLYLAWGFTIFWSTGSFL